MVLIAIIYSTIYSAILYDSWRWSTEGKLKTKNSEQKNYLFEFGFEFGLKSGLNWAFYFEKGSVFHFLVDKLDSKSVCNIHHSICCPDGSPISQCLWFSVGFDPNYQRFIAIEKSQCLTHQLWNKKVRSRITKRTKMMMKKTSMLEVRRCSLAYPVSELNCNYSKQN